MIRHYLHVKIQSSVSVNVMQILLFGRTAKGYGHSCNILLLLLFYFNFFAFFGQISDPREWKVVQI